MYQFQRHSLDFVVELFVDDSSCVTFPCHTVDLMIAIAHLVE
jgi:hypothetical protein